MKTVSVTDLKAQLSKYLRMVRRGSEVQVLERGVPIARIVGLRGGEHDGRVDRLAKAGVLRRGGGDLSWLIEDTPLKVRASLSQALDEDRADRL